MKERKVNCYRCGSKNCFEQEIEKINNYLCSACGFTSTAKLVPESSYTKGIESKNPKIVNELKFYDKKNPRVEIIVEVAKLPANKHWPLPERYLGENPDRAKTRSGPKREVGKPQGNSKAVSKKRRKKS